MAADLSPTPLFAVASFEQLEAAANVDMAGDVFPVPEWGLSVKLRGLTHGEVSLMFEREGAARNAFLLASSLIEPVLTEEQAAELLAKKSFAGAQALLNRVVEVSGLNAGFQP